MRELLRDLDILFEPRTKRRVKLAVLGSIAVAFMEVIGLALVLPLVQVLSGVERGGLLSQVYVLFGRPDRNRLAIILACMAFGAFIVKAVLTVIFRYWMLGFINDQEASTSVDLLRRYLAAPYWLHLQRNTAEMVRNMNDSVSQTYSSVVLGLISAITEVATIAGIGSVLLVLEPLTAIVAITYFGIAGLAFQRLIRGPARRAGEEVNDAAFDTYRSAFHAIGGVKEIKVRQNAGHFIADYSAARRHFAAAKRSSSFLSDLPRYVLEVLFILGVALMTVVVFSTNPSQDALAVVALFVAGGFRVLPSLVRLHASVTTVRIGRRGFDLVLADLTQIDGHDSILGPDGPPTELQDRICVEHVSYRYPGNEVDVLHDVSLVIPAGQSIALVGPSGAGKSTLIDLLLGLHRPTTGRITADGRDIDETLPNWQASIGLVPQDVYLLDDSLRANIALGEADDVIDDERLDEAIALAQLDELVATLPDGLLTAVGERGTRLSAGQRQRLGIARALYLRPRLLVLDEATSALDNDTEQRISSTVDSLHGRLTIVVVAHRLSTVRNCDQLAFLDGGVIETVGTFSTVYRENPKFAALVQLADLAGADAIGR